MIELTPTQERIIEAAGRCFQRTGVQRATIGEIALEAGLSRKTVNRLFGDRQSLIGSILKHRFREVLEATRDRILQYSSFEESIVEGHIYSMHWLDADEIFQELVAGEETHGVDLILMGDPEVNALFHSVWLPVFLKARHDGVIVSSLPDNRLVEGYKNTVSMLALRTDFDDKDRRRFLIDFLLPSMIGLKPVRSKAR